MDIRLPRLGEGADNGTVVSLFVKEGDDIKKDQTLIELENEKAVASIPSPSSGKVSQIRVKVGDKIAVGHVILTLAEGGNGSIPSTPAQAKPQAQAPTAPPAAPQAFAPSAPFTMSPLAASQSSPAGFPPPASPSVRKMARDLGIDLSRVQGSEHGGRITLGDVRAYVIRVQQLAFQASSSAPVTITSVPSSTPPKPKESIDFSKWGPVTHQSLTSLRKIIASRMQENAQIIPHVTQFDEIDITDLSALQKKHAPKFEKKGARLTLTAIMLKSIVSVLKKYPLFNASLDEAREEIVLKNYYHIGIAVDTEQGLIVPVMRDVDQKSILDLSKELSALAAKTRDRKVSADDLKGGTFTISNQGAFGGSFFTPIINRPESAILGIGRSSLKPVVLGKKIEPRLLLPIGLSYDHRIIDGGSAARFVVDLAKAFAEFPEKDLKV